MHSESSIPFETFSSLGKTNASLGSTNPSKTDFAAYEIAALMPPTSIGAEKVQRAIRPIRLKGRCEQRRNCWKATSEDANIPLPRTIESESVLARLFIRRTMKLDQIQIGESMPHLWSQKEKERLVERVRRLVARKWPRTVPFGLRGVKAVIWG